MLYRYIAVISEAEGVFMQKFLILWAVLQLPIICRRLLC